MVFQNSDFFFYILEKGFRNWDFNILESRDS